jgi:hypothetical protein
LESATGTRERQNCLVVPRGLYLPRSIEPIRRVMFQWPKSQQTITVSPAQKAAKLLKENGRSRLRKPSGCNKFVPWRIILTVAALIDRTGQKYQAAASRLIAQEGTPRYSLSTTCGTVPRIVPKQAQQHNFDKK